jgi:transcriptional regulator with XRE-family HTH domain
MRKFTGSELRAIRLEIGLSQARLARELDVTVTTVARWERGEQTIGSPAAIWLALQALKRGIRAPVEEDVA